MVVLLALVFMGCLWLTVTALPSSVLNIVMVIVLDKSRPSSHPRNPVAKQLRFIVADIHIYNLVSECFTVENRSGK